MVEDFNKDFRGVKSINGMEIIEGVMVKSSGNPESQKMGIMNLLL